MRPNSKPLGTCVRPQRERDLREATEGKGPPQRRKSPSHVEMAEDVLRSAGRPLHVHDLLEQIERRYDVMLNRESLVSALLKHVARGRFVKTGKNTFGLPGTDSAS